MESVATTPGAELRVVDKYFVIASSTSSTSAININNIASQSPFHWAELDGSPVKENTTKAAGKISSCVGLPLSIIDVHFSLTSKLRLKDYSQHQSFFRCCMRRLRHLLPQFLCTMYPSGEEAMSCASPIGP
jgi:hypothetical protein